MIPIKDIVKKAGGPAAIGRRIGRTSAAVSQWTRVPIDHVHVVAEMSGLRVEVLRPDVFNPQTLMTQPATQVAEQVSP